MKKESYIIAFWSPIGIPSFHFCLEYFNDYLKKYGDIQCLDCSARPFGERLRHFLGQVDLVVIVLDQNMSGMDDYFCRQWQAFRNVVYLITDYFPSGIMNEAEIRRRYRISSQRLAFIPFNARYEEYVRRNRGYRYLRAGKQDSQTYECCIGFWDKLKESARIFIRALEYRE